MLILRCDFISEIRLGISCRNVPIPSPIPKKRNPSGEFAFCAAVQARDGSFWLQLRRFTQVLGAEHDSVFQGGQGGI